VSGADWSHNDAACARGAQKEKRPTSGDDVDRLDGFGRLGLAGEERAETFFQIRG